MSFLSHIIPADPLRLFLQENRAGLENAALLLGGTPAKRNVQLLVHELGRQPELTRTAKARLISLVDLLALENVGDLDRLESGLFMDIDLESPIVGEICLLTDGLQDAIDAYGKWALAHGAEALVMGAA